MYSNAIRIAFPKQARMPLAAELRRSRKTLKEKLVTLGVSKVKIQ